MYGAVYAFQWGPLVLVSWTRSLLAEAGFKGGGGPYGTNTWPMCVVFQEARSLLNSSVVVDYCVTPVEIEIKRNKSEIYLRSFNCICFNMKMYSKHLQSHDHL